MQENEKSDYRSSGSRNCYAAYVVIRLVVGLLLASSVANIYQPGWECGAVLVGGWMMGSAMKEIFPAAGTFIMHNAKVPWLD